MGQSQSVFPEGKLHSYTECTFFSPREIAGLYRRFAGLNPDKIDRRTADVSTRLSFLEVQSMAELRENPFAERLCEVFSTDGKGLQFEDFLDMFSVLSARAPWDLKSVYAFRVYDFNNDSSLCEDDIKQVIMAITGDRLTEQELHTIAIGVMDEADTVSDGKLTYAEFEHVILRSPDFVSVFHVTV